MDTIKTHQIEIGGKLLDIEPDKLSGNVQINLVGDVSGSVDTPIEAGSTINIHTQLEKEIPAGGIEEAPVDNKQYARKNRTWVEVEGGGADNTFVVTPGGIAGITDTPTPFLDIKAAFQANKIIQAHGFADGQGVYGYLQDFVFNETTGKGSIVFAFSNSNPNYMNGVDFIITCHYDASANPTDTWQQDAQMPIPAPTASDANKVLKVNGSGSAVGWDKVKSSELNNDAGFSKFVVSETPPAAGTPNDVVTVILGNAGGAGDYGAWELIGEGTNVAVNTQINLSRSVKEFDFVILQAFGLYGSNNYNGSCIYNTGTISYGSTDIYCGSDYGNGVRICFLSSTQIKITELFGAFKSFKIYGINLRGKENVYSTEERAIGKWIDGSTIYRKMFYASADAPMNSWRTFATDSTIKQIISCNILTSLISGFVCSSFACGRVDNGALQAYSVNFGWKADDKVIIEYTKNED